MAQRPRTVPKKQAKQSRSRATVEAILEAASRVLVRDGYDKTSTTRIAETAGVSVGSLYQYFPGKEAIVAELIERHVAAMYALVERELAQLAGVAPARAVRRLVEVFFSAYAVDPRLRRVFVEQVPRVGRLAKLRQVEQDLLGLTRAYLEAHRATLRPRDLDAAAYVVLRAVTAVTYGAVVEGSGDVASEVLIGEITDLVVRYLGLPAEPGPRRGRRASSESA